MHKIDRRQPRALGGFTLIEVMIAVTVVGILAAVAVPNYQDYVARGKVTEALSLASGAKVAVVDSYQDSRSLPADNAAANLPAPEAIQGKYVGSVAVEDGNILVTFNDAVSQLEGRSLILQASANEGAVNWCCYSPDIAPRLLPSNCRDSAGCLSGATTPDGGDGSGSSDAGGSGSEDTGSEDTGSGDTGSGDTGSGDTGSGDTGSGDTGSGNLDSSSDDECPSGFESSWRGNSRICTSTDPDARKCPKGWKKVGGRKQPLQCKVK